MFQGKHIFFRITVALLNIFKHVVTCNILYIRTCNKTTWLGLVKNFIVWLKITTKLKQNTTKAQQKYLVRLNKKKKKNN